MNGHIILGGSVFGPPHWTLLTLLTYKGGGLLIRGQHYLRNATGKTKIIGSNGFNICIKGIIDNASALL